MATGFVLPPSLDSTSSPPNLFDGTTRLYVAYICPYARRTWITRNYKGMQDKIKLVPIDLQNKPSLYKEKVYHGNKVRSLEHNNEVKGESLDLIKYIDEHFEGPALFPDDPVKQQFAEELFSHSDTFNHISFKKKKDALSKFDDGPFFLGQFSLAQDHILIHATFTSNFEPNSFRPELNKIDAYTQTRQDPQELLALTKKRVGIE